MLTEGKSADGKASSAGDESAGGKTAENGQSKVIKNEETELEFDGDIALSDSWNGQYAVDGGVLRISSVDYNGKLDAGGSAEDVGFIISGEPGLAIQ